MKDPFQGAKNLFARTGQQDERAQESLSDVDIDRTHCHRVCGVHDELIKK